MSLPVRVTGVTRVRQVGIPGVFGRRSTGYHYLLGLGCVSVGCTFYAAAYAMELTWLSGVGDRDPHTPHRSFTQEELVESSLPGWVDGHSLSSRGR